MVKKLFKHEFLAYGRVMSIVYTILLTIAVTTRVIFLFENDSTPYEIISTFSILTYAVSVFAALAFSFVMALVRFYKNLFTAEGYLSFTLPVTAAQHIIVKAVTAVCVDLVTLLAVLISACIVTAGEVFSQFWDGLTFAFAEIYKLIGAHTILFSAEYLLLLIVALFVSTMLYYTCISIGQLSRKNRILAAVGAYFGYYILTQIVATAFLISFALTAAGGHLDGLARWLAQQLSDHPLASIHIGIWIGILLESAFLLLEFVIVKKIITKKLNLE